MAQIAGEPTVGPEVVASGTEAASQGVVGRTPWQLFWRRFRRDKFAIAGLVFLAIVAVVAFAAPLFARLTGHGPNDVFLREVTTEVGLPTGPSSEFWFGGTRAGQDLFVRVIYGARTSLSVALVATGISLFIGVLLGLAAGYYRGKTDTVISRITDIVLSLPILLLALGLVAACGLSREGCLGGLIRPGLLLVSYVIGLFSWPYIARIVRGQVLSLREKEFIEAARSQGAGDFRIMLREVLPNVIAPIIVYTTLIIPNNILFEAALSFLGIGVPPTTPSWGRMLADASVQGTYTVAPWTMVFPGIFLFMTTLAFNLVGDGLRDALDPRPAR
ncbi:MAG TPA: ABC transporter permease [Actinomycetota bacterium]|nr:ABC transporter permease [Actinomycetota bacterium]